MVDIPIRGRGRGRSCRQPGATLVASRRGPGRAFRAVRVDTPSVVVEDAVDSVAHSAIQPEAPPVQFEPWFAEQGPGQMQQGTQIVVVPSAQQIPAAPRAPDAQYATPDPPSVTPVVLPALGITPELVQLLEQLVIGAVDRQHIDIPPVIAPVAVVVPDVPLVSPTTPIVPYPILLNHDPTCG